MPVLVLFVALGIALSGLFHSIGATGPALASPHSHSHSHVGSDANSEGGPWCFERDGQYQGPACGVAGGCAFCGLATLGMSLPVPNTRYLPTPVSARFSGVDHSPRYRPPRTFHPA